MQLAQFANLVSIDQLRRRGCFCTVQLKDFVTRTLEQVHALIFTADSMGDPAAFSLPWVKATLNTLFSRLAVVPLLIKVAKFKSPDGFKLQPVCRKQISRH